MVFHREVPVTAKAVQIFQALARILQALANEVVRFLQALRIAEQFCVDSEHALAHGIQRVFPAAILEAAGKQAIDARLAVLLVFQQLVGDAT